MTVHEARAAFGRPATPRRRELAAPHLAAMMIAPALVSLLAIIAYPLLYALFLSLHRVSVRELQSGVMPFVGLDNFRAVLADPVFRLAFRHTFIFVSLSVALETLLGIGIALVINDRSVKIAALTRVLILLPWAVPPIVNGLLWSFIYNSKYGYLNVLLHNLGVIDEFVQWTGNADLALYMVVLPYVWRTTPFAVLLFHAALQGIPAELYEAAAVDGAGAWHRFWRITLPLLAPTIMVVLVLRTAFAFMVFDEIFALTGGGPGNATWTAAWYVYRTTFQPPFEIGVGAAAAYAMALVIFAIAFLYVKFLYRDIQYG